MRPKMALKVEGSSIIVSGTRAVIGLAETDNTISPKELVYDPLNPTNTLSGLRRLLSLQPRWSNEGR